MKCNSWMEKIQNWYCDQECLDISVVVLNKNYKQLKVILEEKYPDIYFPEWQVTILDEVIN